LQELAPLLETLHFCPGEFHCLLKPFSKAVNVNILKIPFLRVSRKGTNGALLRAYYDGKMPRPGAWMFN
jgi:hypothetical protein